jgi:imidazolonepropionase
MLRVHAKHEVLTKFILESIRKRNVLGVICRDVVEESEQIMNAGAHFGLKPKIHVNQFNSIGGFKWVKHKALSVDHLEIMTPEDIEALKNMETMPVAYLLALIS